MTSPVHPISLNIKQIRHNRPQSIVANIFNHEIPYFSQEKVHVLEVIVVGESDTLSNEKFE